MRKLSLLALPLALASLAPAQTTCVNRKITDRYVSVGLPAYYMMWDFEVSADGRFLCFNSAEAHDPTTDFNGDDDVYVADMESPGVFERISVSMTGGDANGKSWDPDISANGRFVVFTSAATNLVPGDTEGATDVFLRDRVLGTTRRLSQTAAGSGGFRASSESCISADGRFAAFQSEAPNLVPQDLDFTMDVFVVELATGQLAWISQSSLPQDTSFDSFEPRLSGDGQRVVFYSRAPGLVAGPTSGWDDVYLHDRGTTTTIACARTPSGGIPNRDNLRPDISDDGSTVVFESTASDLHPADTDSILDIYAFDVATQALELVTIATNGSGSNGSAGKGRLSSDGRYVSFNCNGSNLCTPPPPTLNDRAYVRDRQTGITVHASYRYNGNWPGISVDAVRISGDGSRVVFITRDARIVLPWDSDNQPDFFGRDCPFVTPTAYCVANENSLGCAPGIGSTGTPSVSGATPFSVELAAVRSQVSGLLLYSTTGPALTTLFSDYLCVRSPLRRTAVQTSGGTPAGGDCTGTFQFDFGALLSSGADPALLAGVSAWTQYWSRDSGSQGSSHLSNALAFQIQP